MIFAMGSYTIDQIDWKGEVYAHIRKSIWDEIFDLVQL